MIGPHCVCHWCGAELAQQNQIRDEAGVKVIPGFSTAKDGLKEFRDKMRAKETAARAAVRAQLQQEPRAST